MGLNANVDDTILHYYQYNSYEGIIICVLVLLHFIPTYPEYVLITVYLSVYLGISSRPSFTLRNSSKMKNITYFWLRNIC